MAGHPDPIWEQLVALVASGRLQLHNARAEFACNSSSSHSIVILPEDVRARLSASASNGDFGWDNFTLTTSTDKVRYLAAMLTDTPELADSLRRQGGITADCSGDYVDHDSVLAMPADPFGDLDTGYVSALADLLADPRVTVLGGNDNDAGHPLAGTGRTIIDRHRAGGPNWTARHDHLDGHDWWVLFNRNDGTKARISLHIDDIIADWHPSKAPVPELVDIKLTDRCPFEKDCGFCYMGSSVKGAQGDIARVENLLCALSALSVPEVAFGGGEPTTWRHFARTLTFARSVGVIPNFTSKNYRIIDTHPEWVNTAGSVAFSVNDAAALATLDRYYQAADYDTQHQIGIQTIPDLVAGPDLDAIFAWAATNGARLTLLGYKTTGRGSQFQLRYNRPPGWWIPAAAKHRWLRLAIDTVLAETSAGVLAAAGVPDWSYHTAEGAFSAYVDTVTGAFGPSSFTDRLQPIDLDAATDTLAEQIRSGFATW